VPDHPPVLTLAADRLAWRETGEEVVVLDLQGSVYFGLNASAAPLWTMLARGTTREELVARLLADQQVDRDRAAADVDAFLAALVAHGFVAPLTG
jgi:hypothetical protein